MDQNDRYAKRGVSSDKEDVHAAIRNIDKGLFPNAFCKIVPDYLADSPDHCIVMHADGAGTKSSLAYMYWKETGDISVWKGIAQDAVIMNVDDLLCVGATGPILLSSTIGRNKNLISGAVISEIIEGTESVLSDLRKNGLNIESTGGETADVGDLVRTVIVDSTVVARMKKSDVISNKNIQDGDVIVGLSSFGQANYESEYNGGMGSNGLTSARHDVFAKYLAEKYTESFEVGDPKKEGEHIGPVISEAQYSKIQTLIQKGIDEGAKLVAGGTGKPEGLDKGYFVKPTVFADVNNDMEVARTEIFGPVLSVIPFETEEDAIKIANDTAYGLTNYIQTQDSEKVQRVARKLRSGMVDVNGAGIAVDAPFGGFKHSGIGREAGEHGLEEFLEVKAVGGWS